MSDLSSPTHCMVEAEVLGGGAGRPPMPLSEVAMQLLAAVK